VNLVEEKKQTTVKKVSNVILESDVKSESDTEEEKEDDRLGEDTGDPQAQAQGKLMTDLMKMAGQEEANPDNGFAFKRLASARPNNPTAGLFTKQQIVILQGQIQSLSASANPLGKCIEYIYEDVEHMQKELDKWRREFTKSSKELELEQRRSASILEPLETQLQQASALTEEQERKIASLRAEIFRNQLELEKVMDRSSALGTGPSASN
jgi:chromosome segregation ATPase